MTAESQPQGTHEDIREWMLKLGYVHDSEVEKATSTVFRTRARWKPLRPVYFGKEPYYQLADIKRHLDERAAINEHTDELVSL
jgi:hypothetical protein